MSLGGGGGKVKFPKQKDVLETRYPAAVDLENKMREYFRSTMQSPNQGYTPRKSYNPMELYAASISDRPRLLQGLTAGRPGLGSGGYGAPATGGSSAPASPGGFWSGSAFSTLTPQGPHMVPDWALQEPPSTPPAGEGITTDWVLDMIKKQQEEYMRNKQQEQSQPGPA